MTGSVNLYRSDVRYIGQFTQRSAGGVFGFGYPLGGFTRLFTNYSYEQVRVTEINDALHRSAGAGAQPVPARFPADRRRTASGSSARSRRASSTTRSISRSSRTRACATPHRSTSPAWAATPASTSRRSRGSGTGVRTRGMSLGMRALGEYIHSFQGSLELPIFQKLFLGGEYSVRGFDIRSIGPQDPLHRPGARRQQGACCSTSSRTSTS